MIKLDLDHPVFTRLGNVTYVLGTLLALFNVIGIIFSLISADIGFVAICSFFAVLSYSVGWAVRYILSGNKNYIFKKQIQIQIYKLRVKLKEKQNDR